MCEMCSSIDGFDKKYLQQLGIPEEALEGNSASRDCKFVERVAEVMQGKNNNNYYLIRTNFCADKFSRTFHKIKKFGTYFCADKFSRTFHKIKKFGTYFRAISRKLLAKTTFFYKVSTRKSAKMRENMSARKL